MASPQIEQLSQKLKAAISDGALVIAPGTIAPSAPIDTAFSTYLCNAPLTIQSAYVGIPDGQDFVQLFGTGSSSTSPPNPYDGLKLDGRVFWSTALNAYTLQLTGTSTASYWTLADSFPFFAQKEPLGYAPIDSATFTLESQSDAAAASFTFAGDVPFRGRELAPLLALFSGVAHIPVTGTIASVDASTGVPTFTFSGASSLTVIVGQVFSVTPSLVLMYGISPFGGAPQQALYAVWSLKYGSDAKELDVYAAAPFTDPTLTFSASPEQVASFLFSALSDLAGGSNFGGLMPTQLPMPSGFSLKGWSLEVNPSDLSTVSMSIVGGTTSAWPIIAGISLDQLNFEFQLDSQRTRNINITAIFFLDSAKSTALTLMGSYPSFAFGGTLTSGGIDLKSLVSRYSTDAAALLPPLPLTELSLFVDPTSSIYRFHTSLGSAAQPWSITIAGDEFDLTDVTIDFGAVAGDVTASGSATITLPTTTPVAITLTVAYATKTGWTFEGAVRNLTFQQLLETIAHYFPPLRSIIDEVDAKLGFSGANVIITKLDVKLTPSTGTYHFTFDLNWTLDVGADEPLIISAQFDFDHTAATNTAMLAGTTTYKTFTLGVTLAMDSTADPKWTFGFRWSDFTATYAKPIATFTFGNQSITQIVSTLVDTVLPGQTFSLVSPWDILNTIALTGLQIQLDFSKKLASFRKPLTAANFGFIDLDYVAMTIDWSQPKPPVTFSIPSGTFLGAPFTTPMSWNVLDPQQTPPVPGFGSGLVRVDFLGLGQRYTPIAAIPTASVEGALTALESAFRNAPDPQKGLQYSSTANWILGLEVWLFESSIWLGALFLDEPQLYGIGIHVMPNGRFPQFGNFHCEILYKKLGNDLGVYQAEVTLPDSIRYFNIGAVAVTLPYVAIWIYTNGDFLINFGFPQNGDFSQSFTLQLLPFIGAGGFYFGVLPACSAPTVPATKSDGSPLSGSFNPVIVFGIGIAVGLAEGVSYGIASGGMSLTVQGIIEGAFATYTAYSGTPGGGDLFWSITGQLALVGRIFGMVDFAIVVARFDVTVKVSITFAMAAYRAARFTLTASVTASASISINLGLFSITIGFSFTFSVSDSFTIGNDSQAPWDLGAKPVLRTIGTSLSDPQCTTIPLTWAPVSGTNPLDLWLVPHLTAASPVNADGSLGAAAPQLVTTLYVERSDATPPPAVSAFSTLAQGVLLWVVNAAVNGKPISQSDALNLMLTYDQATSILCTLSAAGASAPFADSDLTGFLDAYLAFTVKQRGVTDAPLTATLFPVAPILTLEVMDQTPIHFDTYNETTAGALQQIRAALAGLQPQSSLMRRAALAGDDELSLATFLFRDYFTMLCKGTVQAAADYLKAAQAKHGDASLDEIARRFDTTAGELASLNRTRQLRRGTTLRLPNGETHGVSDAPTETLLGIARQHGLTAAELASANVATNALFDDAVTITLPVNAPVALQTIVDALQAQGSFDNLGGQAARVALQGLRPPWPTAGAATQALYAVTGQQFDASSFVEGNSYTLSVPDGTKWLAIPDGKVALDANTTALLQSLAGVTIAPPLATSVQPYYDVVPKRFTLATPVKWTAASGTPPAAQGIWQFPSDLVRLLGDNPGLLPLVTLGQQTSDAPHLLPYAIAGSTPPTDYAWATAIPIDIARIDASASPGTPLPYTYNLFGTDAATGALLESLLRLDAQQPVPIRQIYVLFPLAPGSALPTAGVTSDPVENTRFFVMQTNLSTASNPPGGKARRDAGDPTAPVGMTFIEMLRLVWECSVVRSGGYQLFYQATSGTTTTGLPDFLFRKDGHAEVTLLVTYAYDDDRLRPFVDNVVIAQPVDPSVELYIAAVEDARRVESNVPLGKISADAHMTLFELALRNADVPLANGELHLGSANSPVPCTRGETLRSLAKQHGVSLAALAHANRDRVVPFDAPLTIDPILLQRAPAMAAGEIGFDAVRNFPGGPTWNGSTKLTPADTANYIEQQFQLLAYRVAANDAFRESVWGLPLSAADPQDGQPTGGSVFSAVVPIRDLAVDPGADSKLPGQPPPAGDPYRGIGQTVQLELAWHDVFGNVITTATPQPDPYVIDAEVLYFDNLVPVSSWPGLGLSWWIAPDATTQPTLSVELRSDISRYDPAIAGAAWLKTVTADQKRFAAIYYQLARNAAVTLTSTLDPAAKNDVTQPLVAFVVSLYAWLTRMIDSGTYVAETHDVTLAVPVADTSGESLFALEVALTIARTAFVDPSVDDPLLAAASSVTTSIAPKFLPPASHSLADDDPPTSLLQLAQQLQQCFPTLMPASGTPDAIGATPQLFVVRFGSGGFTCSFSDPYYFALPPLSTEPLSLANIGIATYDGSQPLQNAPAVLQSFSNVDLDLLASNFLAAMDLVLSPDYVVPAWQIANPDRKLNPIGGILLAKETLAASIAARLTAPLKSQATPPDGYLGAAQGKLQQELLVRLAPASQIDSIVTLLATVTGPATPADQAPRLFGNPTGPLDASTTRYSLSTASVPLCSTANTSFLAFTFTTADKAAASVVDLAATFGLSHVEYGFDPMPPPMTGYTASSWLTFVIPFAQASPAVRDAVMTVLPSLEIPIPLKAFPSAPTIAVQTATPFLADGTPDPPVAQARLWSYSFSYDYAGASQDDVHARINFTQPSLRERVDDTPALEAWLLQFNAAWPAILADFNTYVVAPGKDDTRATNALLSFAWLAYGIANAWPVAPVDRAAVFDDPLQLDFTVVQQSQTVDKTDGVLVTIVSNPGGEWTNPTVDLDTYTRVTLAPGTYAYTWGNAGQEQYLPYAQGLALPRRNVAMTPRSAPLAQYYDVLTRQQAWASVATGRNELYNGAAGNRAFIYKSSYARASTPAVPLLAPAVTIDMGDSTSGDAPLATFVDNFLVALLTPAGPTIPDVQVSCAFRYALGAGSTLDVDLPLVLTVPRGVDGTFVDQLAAAIAGALPDTATKHELSGSLIFTFALFSADSAATALPVLRLNDVRLDLSRVVFGG